MRLGVLPLEADNLLGAKKYFSVRYSDSTP